MICIAIDELTPCLKEVETGEIYQTEVISLKRKSFLNKFNKNTGWYVNWSKFPSDVEIYALVLKGTVNIQGLIALSYDEYRKAVYINWACTAPHNNKWEYGVQRFSGVGGHLFAIAADKSLSHGYDGFLYGEAMDRDLYEYYISHFHAEPIYSPHNPYGIMFSDTSVKPIMEVYNYEWTTEEL